MSETTRPRQAIWGPKRQLAIKALAWICIGILMVMALLYVRLLFGPISLGFVSDRVKEAVAGIVEDTFAVDWSDFGLSLTGPLSVGFHLSAVTLTEPMTDAVIEMEALEIELSPIGLALGRPNARVILIEPRFQTLQSLLGPQLTRFELLDDEQTGEAVVRIMEGGEHAPAVQIGDEGLLLDGLVGGEIGLKSDNDWLVLNVEALNQVLAQLSDQAMAGQIRRLDIRDGSVGVLDTVYGLYKSFEHVDLAIRAGRIDGRVSASFSAEIGGQTMDGEIIRRLTGDGASITADIRNIDFSTVAPFLDDANSLAALRGAGRLGLAVDFESGEAGALRGGRFTVDIDGTKLRLNNDQFRIAAEPFVIEWMPAQSLFSVSNVEFTIGQSHGTIDADIVMGFDGLFGPTLGMSVRGRDLWLHPDDLDAPAAPFDDVHFEGWSAPLYGAIGIDRMVVAKHEMGMVMQGRIDMVRDGVGLDVTLSGRGATADDIKRLWPYLFAREGREWFTSYVSDGRVSAADMRFRFPVGSISLDGEPRPMPQGAMQIDLKGSDVQLLPLDGLPEFQVDGEAQLTMRDNQLTMAFERARVPEFGAAIAIENAAYINQDVSATEQIFEVSGDVSGPVPAILGVASGNSMTLLDDFDTDIDLAQLARDLSGQVATTVIATIATDDTGRLVSTDYALNGVISNLASVRPIQGFSFSDSSLVFTASQEGFRVLGDANVGTQGVGEARIEIEATQSGNAAPQFVISSTLNVADAAAFGIDLSEFMQGSVRVTARPVADGRIELAADLADTALTISDVGVSKQRGTSGQLDAVIRLDDSEISVSDLSLAFGTVRLQGDMLFGASGDLRSANFSNFQISPGDSARVSMSPIDGGYAFAVQGEQLDIKPVLKRFFNLEGDTTAAASTDLQDQIFNVRVNLDRALGYYGTAAFNVDLDLSVQGEQLRRVNLAAQFGGDRSASATTNPLSSGRVISYATNDLGQMLRFIGVYPRLAGGEGSMVMRYNPATNTDTGEFAVRNFAIVDEGNLGVIIGSHDESRQAVGGASAIEFDFGRAEFVRYSDRIEVVDALVHSDMVGGTIRGNVLTEAGRYDLAGTYVPLFGLNNFFQKIPLLGPLFGGREGEGLIGVTFAVRGPLDDPQLLVNPVSILAPGVFRTLFEYRAANQGGP